MRIKYLFLVSMASLSLFALGCNKAANNADQENQNTIAGQSSNGTPQTAELDKIIKANKISGAIIQEFVKESYETKIWAVKAGGMKELVASFPMLRQQSVFGGKGDANFDRQIEYTDPSENLLSADKSLIMVESGTKRRVIDLSKIFPKLKPSKFWQDFFASKPKRDYMFLSSYAFSPDGKYLIGEGGASIKLYTLLPSFKFSAVDADTSSALYSTMLSQPDVLVEFSSTTDVPHQFKWSADGKKLMYRGYANLLGGYDFEKRKNIFKDFSFPPATAMNESGTKLDTFIDFVNDTYLVNRVDGTYAFTYQNNKYSSTKIFPASIKLIGLIP